MRAEVVSVGTELLLGQIVDTNAAKLGQAFAAYGLAHTHRQTVGDNQERLVEALRLALARADVIVTIGGLGPTEDDMTRDGIAEALGDTLEVDEGVAEHLRKMFESRGLPWLDSQLRQAMRPTCATPISNPNGTAPGLLCKKNGKVVVAMPGPGNEFVPMLEGPVGEVLRQAGGGQVIHSVTLKLVGIGESLVEERVRDLLKSESPTLATYAKTGEVHLRLTARATSVEEALEIIRPVEQEVRTRLGRHVIGGELDSLESALLDELRTRGQTLAVAESCTGGAIGARLTEVPGSSASFVGGAISYSNAVKVSSLGVLPQTLEEHGAVSANTAHQMAEGARDRFSATWGLSVTGIAGPGGGTEDKPVGLVYVGVAGPSETQVFEHRFVGRRDAVRRRASQAALAAVRSAVMAGDDAS